MGEREAKIVGYIKESETRAECVTSENILHWRWKRKYEVIKSLKKRYVKLTFSQQMEYVFWIKINKYKQGKI